MATRALACMIVIGALTLTACGTNPMKATPQQLDQAIEETTGNQTLSGSKYVDCTLNFAEKQRNSKASAGGIADAAANKCRGLARDYGEFRHRAAVLLLAKNRQSQSEDELSAHIAAVPSAEFYSREFIAQQRPAVIVFVSQSRGP